MSITVAKGTLSRIREYPDQIVLQVQGAADPEAAATALTRAADDIWNLDGGPASAHGLGPQDRNNPKFVSGVFPAGTGPFVFIDAGYTPYKLLRTIPDIVARHLTEAGVEDAVIAAPPPGGPLAQSFYVDHLPYRAVVLRLYPPPPPAEMYNRYAQVPDGWLEEAAVWVGAGLDADTPALAEVEMTEFPLPVGEALAFWRQCAKARPRTSVLVSGDLGSRIRGGNGCLADSVPSVALAAGGPAASDDELVATVEAFVDVARRLAPKVVWAYVAIDPTFGALVADNPGSEWAFVGGERSDPVVDLALDEIVHDAFCYQILGPGHLRRLGAMPPGAIPLGGGRVELAIGEPEAWLLDPSEPERRLEVPARRRDPGIQEKARAILSPCLMREGEARDLVSARRFGPRQAQSEGSGT